MQNGVIFDLDGTLIDSRADLALAVNLTRADLGLAPLPQDQVVGYVGEGVRKLLARALPECPERLDQALAINSVTTRPTSWTAPACTPVCGRPWRPWRDAASG